MAINTTLSMRDVCGNAQTIPRVTWRHGNRPDARNVLTGERVGGTHDDDFSTTFTLAPGIWKLQWFLPPCPYQSLKLRIPEGTPDGDYNAFAFVRHCQEIPRYRTLLESGNHGRSLMFR